MIEEIYCFARLPKDPKNFWELNTELKYIVPFNKLFEKEGSAIMMTAIWLVCDPKSSYVNSAIPEELCKEQVAKNFLKKAVKWSDYREYIDAYKNFCKTKIEKELDSLYLILKERQQTGEDLDWETDFEKKDKIILTQPTYYEKYVSLRAKLKEEREENLAHGKYTPSRMEARGQDY